MNAFSFGTEVFTAGDVGNSQLGNNVATGISVAPVTDPSVGTAPYYGEVSVLHDPFGQTVPTEPGNWLTDDWFGGIEYDPVFGGFAPAFPAYDPATGLDDHADGMTGASFLQIGQPITGTIDTASDTDWFVVNLQEGQTYTFDLLGATNNGGDLLDPILHLTNGVGEDIRESDDYGYVGDVYDYDPQIVFTPEHTGTFFLHAEGVNGETGSYTLQASVDYSTLLGSFEPEYTDYTGYTGYEPTAFGGYETIQPGYAAEVGYGDVQSGYAGDLGFEAWF